MRIVILIGIHDTGKTATLNILYGLLVANGAISDNNRVVLGNPIQNDFSETMQWKNKKIGFFTMGDYPRELAKGVRSADNAKCDILICACSRFTATLLGILRQYNVQIVNKTVALNPQQFIAVNTTDAQTIFNLI